MKKIIDNILSILAVGLVLLLADMAGCESGVHMDSNEYYGRSGK